jgi:osmotically inducible protein OsmC
MKILYTAEATAHGGREGHTRTSDGTLDLKLSTPKALGGSGEAGTNPEQLFAAGYAACFQSALMLVARRQHVDASQSIITSKVGIGPNGEGGFALEVELYVSIPGLDRVTSEQLVAQAHQICPYSNATRGNIPVTLTVE